MNIHVQAFMWIEIFTSLRYVPNSITARTYGNCSFEKNLPNCCSECLYCLTFILVVHGRSYFCAVLPEFGGVTFFFTLAILVGMYYYLIVVLIFPMTRKWNIFMISLQSVYLLHWNVSCLLLIFYLDCCFLIVEFGNSLHNLDITTFLDMQFAEIFSKSIIYLLILFIWTFKIQMIMSNWSSFLSMDHDFGIKSKNSLPSPRSWRISFVNFPNVFCFLLSVQSILC